MFARAEGKLGDSMVQRVKPSEKDTHVVLRSELNLHIYISGVDLYMFCETQSPTDKSKKHISSRKRLSKSRCI